MIDNNLRAALIKLQFAIKDNLNVIVSELDTDKDAEIITRKLAHAVAKIAEMQLLIAREGV